MNKPPSIHDRLSSPPSRRVRMVDKIRGSSQWQAHRSAMLDKMPWCVMCVLKEPDRAPSRAREVHHVHQLEHALTMAFEPSNTPPVCSDCHAKVSMMERNGKGAEAIAIFSDWIQRIKEAGYGHGL